MGLNPLTAALLGIDGMLSAKRHATDDAIDVQIRTPDGHHPVAAAADPLAQDQRDAGAAGLIVSNCHCRA